MIIKNHFLKLHQGDISGIALVITNNLVHFIIVISTLTALGWPNYLVYFRVVPGMAIGVLIGGFYYAYMGFELARKEKRTDVTAIPFGISTPAMFVFLFGIITPLQFVLDDPEMVWRASVAACFLGGLIEFIGGFIGPWLKENIPRAAMLGTISGIAFIWMATQGVFDLFGDPVLGLPLLLLAIMGLFGGYLFFRKISPFVVAIVGGVLYALVLGRVQPDFTGIELTLPNPIKTINGMLDGFRYIAPYLVIIIPMEVYNFLVTMNNVEVAETAGDKYNVREAQFVDGSCTMISAIFGGIIPNTVWMNHPGLKKSGAGISYAWISGLCIGIMGLFGLFAPLHSMVPIAVTAVTFLWVGVVIVSHAFKKVNVKHYAAVIIAMIPPVADFIYSQITSAMGYLGVRATPQVDGLPGFSDDITSGLIASGVMWSGVPAIRSGSLVIGILLGTVTVFIIDRQLRKAGIVFMMAAVLSLFGFIHSATLAFAYRSPFPVAYTILAVMCFVLSYGASKWFDVSGTNDD